MTEETKNTPTNTKKTTSKGKHTQRAVKKNTQKKKPAPKKKPEPKPKPKPEPEEETQENKEELSPEAKAKLEKVKASQKKRDDEKKEKEKLKKLKRDKIITTSIAVGTVLGVYILGVIIFSLITYPRTTVADTDVSLRTNNFMKEALAPNSTDYTLHVTGLNFDIDIPGDKIDYSFDVDEVVKRINDLKNPLTWPFDIFMIHDFKDNFVVAFNEEKTNTLVGGEIDEFNKHATAPIDAGFNIDIATKTVTAKDEVIGDSLDKKETLKTVKTFIGTARRNLELTENEHLNPKLTSKDPRMPKAVEQANTAIKADLKYMMSSANVFNVDTKMIADLLTLTPDYTAELNSEGLTLWAHDKANTYNTKGTTRTFTTPYGKTCTVKGGTQGWLIDEDALKETTSKNVMSGTVTTLNVPCSQDTNGYTTPGGRDWGARYIDIDLSEQHARMYTEAGLAWETDIVSGKPDEKHATPTGVFCINFKESPSKLVGENTPEGKPEYETKVQYWMAFVGNGVGIHDANWQGSFGGTRYQDGYGSHGCVNVSVDAAAALYGICVPADIVVCHD